MRLAANWSVVTNASVMGVVNAISPHAAVMLHVWGVFRVHAGCGIKDYQLGANSYHSPFGGPNSVIVLFLPRCKYTSAHD